MRRLREKSQGEIEAKRPKTSLPQDFGVAAGPTSEIQNGPRRILTQNPLNEIDMDLGLAQISVRI